MTINFASNPGQIPLGSEQVLSNGALRGPDLVARLLLQCLNRPSKSVQNVGGA
jgi:hypothetical protein